LRFPDPLGLAVALATAVVVAAWIKDFGRGPADPGRLGLLGIGRSFFAGMWAPDQLAFAFQIAGVLTFGHVLADAPLVRRALLRMADVPRTPAGAAVFVSVAAMAMASLTWGLGLMGGALLARAVTDAFRRRGETIDAALVAAAGYMGLGVWHGGLSGSAPLTVAKAADAARPAALAGVPLIETTFSTRNLALLAAFFVVVPLALAWTARRGGGAARAEDAAVPAADVPPAPPAAGPGSYVAAGLLAVTLLLGLLAAVGARGPQAVDLHFVLGASFLLGLALHGSLRAYGAAFERAAGAAAGVLLQFPLYFGLIGVAKDSGLLADVLSAFMSLVETAARVLPVDRAAALVTFVSACVMNLFVPSGGGQWAVQGPVVAATARDLGIAPGPLVMAFAYGDQCTNLLQPFWAVPLLAITRVRAGALFAKTAFLCAVVFVTTAVALVV
jgi:short-chain fatty acids transporter